MRKRDRKKGLRNGNQAVAGVVAVPATRGKGELRRKVVELRPVAIAIVKRSEDPAVRWLTTKTMKKSLWSWMTKSVNT